MIVLQYRQIMNIQCSLFRIAVKIHQYQQMKIYSKLSTHFYLTLISKGFRGKWRRSKMRIFDYEIRGDIWFKDIEKKRSTIKITNICLSYFSYDVFDGFPGNSIKPKYERYRSYRRYSRSPVSEAHPLSRH
jgi:hypothetical protein